MPVRCSVAAIFCGSTKGGLLASLALLGACNVTPKSSVFRTATTTVAVCVLVCTGSVTSLIGAAFMPVEAPGTSKLERVRRLGPLPRVVLARSGSANLRRPRDLGPLARLTVVVLTPKTNDGASERGPSVGSGLLGLVSGYEVHRSGKLVQSVNALSCCLLAFPA